MHNDKWFFLILKSGFDDLTFLLKGTKEPGMILKVNDTPVGELVLRGL